MAKVLNARDAESMREGFITSIINSRGMHLIEPDGRPEKELMKYYQEKADAIENIGYHRFADTIRKISKTYENDAQYIIAEHQYADDE